MNEIKRENVFSVYVKSNQSQSDDLLAVKEILHHPDGTRTRNLRLIKNYKRKFYITKPEYRDHQDKKEFEPIERLNEYECTQAVLAKEMYRILTGKTTKYVSLPEIHANPYVYGTDVTTPVLLGEEYRERWPDTMSESTMAVLDFETDMVDEEGLILSGVLSFKDRVHIAVRKDFLKINSLDECESTKEKIQLLARKHLGKMFVDRNITLSISLVENAADVVISIIGKAHQWQPDFIGIWNIEFDVTKMVMALEKYGYNPAQVFSDPSVPDEFKYFRWQPDSKFKTTASGARRPKAASEKWNTVICPASFYFICLMSLFRKVRAREKQRNSYGLDGILKDYLKLGKLHFDELGVAHLSGPEWHRRMQTKHKLEYIIYMINDGIPTEMLDEITKDCRLSLRSMVGKSEISKMNSNPKRLSDDMYFHMLKQNCILGTTSKDMTTELDELTPSLRGWIITLSSDLCHGIGNNVLEEFPDEETNVTYAAGDIDVTGAYPTGEEIENISKATRAFEVCKIKGLTVDQQRSIGINLTSLRSNPINIAKLTHNFPAMDLLLEEFMKEI